MRFAKCRVAKGCRKWRSSGIEFKVAGWSRQSNNRTVKESDRQTSFVAMASRQTGSQGNTCISVQSRKLFEMQALGRRLFVSNYVWNLAGLCSDVQIDYREIDDQHGVTLYQGGRHCENTKLRCLMF